MHEDSGISLGSRGRRQLLLAATAGAGLALLPGMRVLAARASEGSGPTVAMGYRAMRADDAVVDALSIAPAPATYELRVLAANTDVPLAIDAQYAGNARHRFWQAWSERGMLQSSPRSGICWWAENKMALPLVVWLGGPGYAQVTARAGTYILAVGPNGQRLPAWEDLALRAPALPGADSRLLLRSSSEPVAFPYLLFSVQPMAVL